MNIKKAIRFNKFFIIFQIIAFIADVILFLKCDINIYFPIAWFISAITIIYCALVGTVITHKYIYKKPDYCGIINITSLSTDIKIFRLAKKITTLKSEHFQVSFFC